MALRVVARLTTMAEECGCPMVWCDSPGLLGYH